MIVNFYFLTRISTMTA